MEVARHIHVPFQADSVGSPELRYSVGDDPGVTCMAFYDDEGLVRVTFEGFDSVRCCRGEHGPYDLLDADVAEWKGDFAKTPWVFEVENSSWLHERHAYEMKHYDYPLLEEFVHYLFRFHDEFVELIAKGIWFDRVTYDQLSEYPVDHPLNDLPGSLPAEEFVVDGIRCNVRRNPMPLSPRLADSRLCSQVLFQYAMTLDGQPHPSYSALVRTRRHGTKTRLRRGALFYKDLAEADGVADESAFRPAFAKYVSEVADRRRQIGKSP